jgi:hypothetical protein
LTGVTVRLWMSPCALIIAAKDSMDCRRCGGRYVVTRQVPQPEGIEWCR